MLFVRTCMSSESEAIRRLNAERVTFLAEDFMKRLGYGRGVKPRKVSLEGERYVVEMELKKKTAKVQIDLTTQEIKSYEIQEAAAEQRFSLSRRNLFLLIGFSAIAVLAIVLKLMNFF